MNSLYICIFGGTTEGRLFAEFLSKKNIKADLFIATEYGQQFVKNIGNINVYQKRLDEKEMTNLFLKKKYDYVIDATHPFAKIVSENIIKSTYVSGTKHIRIIRNSYENKCCKYFDTLNDCVDYLKNKEGNILLSTGSKNLDKFTIVKNYEEKMYVRILPMESSLKRCIDLGFSNKNIICMQGPFSEELNVAMLKSTNSKYMVTKESASSGGFDEKVQACIKTGTECLVIRKQYEEGLTLDEACRLFMKLRDESGE
ncbi:MAG: precorrin-6A reductase [Sedimentibacter sp.]|uniref:precorrin-6A reductase n=1 Tax=Sedimentibacter sp. TaxID=1960295 RepID=UPI002981FC66|nr:precorrin-6A reductase [Sedimentibacter sp.]MDW5298799.1 precorrin-6A reductase [Sedimentibacter sp.]